MSRHDRERLADIVLAIDTDHAIVRATLDHDLPPLAEAVARLLKSLA